jgi:hypothetical protein
MVSLRENDLIRGDNPCRQGEKAECNFEMSGGKQEVTPRECIELSADSPPRFPRLIILILVFGLD